MLMVTWNVAAGVEGEGGEDRYLVDTGYWRVV